MRLTASIGRARDDGHRTGRPRNAPRNRLQHARDAPTTHAALPPAHQRQGRGWALHRESHQRYKRSGAEQLGHDEQAETETGGRRFAVTVAGLGFGFHLSTPFKRLSPHRRHAGCVSPRLFISSAHRTRRSPWSAPWPRPTLTRSLDGGASKLTIREVTAGAGGA